MSGFQRFVSYINLYEGNKKIRNVGFAKIEQQDGQCKIEIHLKGTGYTGISCPMYLFVRKANQIEGISLGKIQVTNGAGLGNFLLKEENIANSGYGMKQVGGFLIFVTERIMFASEWDDKEIFREQFIELSQEEKPVEAKLSQKEAKAEEKQPQKEIELPQKETKVEEKQPQEEIELSQEEKEETEIAQKEAKVEREQPQEEIEISQKETKAEEKQPQEEIEFSQKETKVEEKQAQEEIELSQEEKEETEIAQKETKVEEKQPQKEIRATEAVAQHKRAPELCWYHKWQFILENYPVMTPFEEEDILCVRLELKDLRLLPQRYWYLGNNSFLLHGFFNYRYLILGLMEEEGKKRWFIGVPGIYQSQERVMASVFGFSEYRSEKTAPQKTGQFGYWYRFLN